MVIDYCRNMLKIKMERKVLVFKMKKIKYLAFGISIVLLSFYLYKNFIYYSIPFNPIKEYASESKIDFFMTKNIPDGEGINTKCKDTNTCDLVLEYFSDLKLVPIKDKAAYEMFKYENSTFYTGMLTFNESDKILISDISIDSPNSLHISSSIDGFKSGYYKIVDSAFDYNYIYNLISETET